MTIPAGTTHVWTPAIDNPRMVFLVRRAYYKRSWGEWYSFSKTLGKWYPTNNEPSWFKTEREAGYLVTVQRFSKPEFVSKKEEN